MIDIHCHILPHIDDGADDIDQAVEMAMLAEREGISEIIATPHYNTNLLNEFSKKVIEEKVIFFNEVLKENNIRLRVHTGCEVFLSPEVPLLIRNGTISTLNSGRYLLLELPLGLIPIYIEKVLYETELLCITPIIAHPERTNEGIGRYEFLQQYIDKGTLLQVNAGSITGFYGERVARIAMELIGKRMVHFVATDAHDSKSRAPLFKEAYEIVTNRMGSETAELLFNINPKKVLDDQEIVFDNTKDNNKSIFSKVFRLMK